MLVLWCRDHFIETRKQNIITGVLIVSIKHGGRTQIIQYTMNISNANFSPFIKLFCNFDEIV